MVNRAVTTALATALLLFAETAYAEDKDNEPVLLELGGVGEWSLLNGGGSFGPTAALDIPVIADWLEIEAGVTPLFSSSHMEWDGGLLFKKPYALSESVEFEIGVGPAWLRTTGAGRTANSLGGEAASFKSGRRRTEGSAGTWSRATATISAAGMNNRLA